MWEWAGCHHEQYLLRQTEPVLSIFLLTLKSINVPSLPQFVHKVSEYFSVSLCNERGR